MVQILQHVKSTNSQNILSKIIFFEKKFVCPYVPSRPVPSRPRDNNTFRIMLPLMPPLLLPLRRAAAAAVAAATKTTAFLGKEKLSYVYSTQFRVSSSLQSRSKAVVCASTPRKYITAKRGLPSDFIKLKGKRSESLIVVGFFQQLKFNEYVIAKLMQQSKKR